MLAKRFSLITAGLALFSSLLYSLSVYSLQNSASWKKDPVGQAVFEGVLEGLIRDQVDAAVVENIIGNPSSTVSREERMKRSFVLNCPLCEPTFEAFLAYQKRLQQQNATKVSKLSQLERDQLLSKNTNKRLDQLAKTVKGWMLTKFEKSDLPENVTLKWKQMASEQAEEGKTELIERIQSDPAYKEWSVYWGCAACNGTRDASEDWKKPASKNPIQPGQGPSSAPE